MTNTTEPESSGQKSRIVRLENFTTSNNDRRYVFCRYTAPDGVKHIIPLLLSGDRALVFPNISELKKTLEGELFAVVGFVDKFVFFFLESTNEGNYDKDAEFERAAATLADLLDGINLSDEDSDGSLNDSVSGQVTDRLAFIEQSYGSLASRSIYFGIYTNPQDIESAVVFYTHGNGYVDIYTSLESFYGHYFGGTQTAAERLDSVTWDFFENRENLEGMPYETDNGEPVPSIEPHFERWLVAKLDAEFSDRGKSILIRNKEKALC